MTRSFATVYGVLLFGTVAAACSQAPAGKPSASTGSTAHASSASSSSAVASSSSGTGGAGGASSAGGAGGAAGGGKVELWILPDYDGAKSDTGGVAGFVSRTGVVPLVISNYMSVTSGSFDTAGAQGFIDQAKAAGVARVSISLATGDADVPTGPQGQIAAAVAYGKQQGVSVAIRFGYEMNGYWSPSNHGGDPTIFQATWAEVAGAVHGAGGQMIWAPNIATGTLTAYQPWIPADTSTVDVVGLDFYHFNATSTDLSLGPTEVDDAFATIYPVAQQLGKPFVLTETAVSYFDDSGTWAVATQGEVDEKKAWLGQLTSPALLAKYPLYRGFAWFDYNKYESSEYRDFSISQQPLEATMLSSFVAVNGAVLSVGP